MRQEQNDGVDSLYFSSFKSHWRSSFKHNDAGIYTYMYNIHFVENVNVQTKKDQP